MWDLGVEAQQRRRPSQWLVDEMPLRASISLRMLLGFLMSVLATGLIAVQSSAYRT
jgi:hypothetical protein